MSTLDLSIIVFGFVGGWFVRKGWRQAQTGLAQRRHRRTLKDLHWRH